MKSPEEPEVPEEPPATIWAGAGWGAALLRWSWYALAAKMANSVLGFAVS